MRNKLLVELGWLGTHYNGWQKQGDDAPGPPSLFEVVHAALKAATGQDGGPVVAGRTDRGVHAMRQLVTVTVRGAPRAGCQGRAGELEALRETVNAALPADVRCYRVTDAAPSAHALHDSVRKTYSYYILSGDDDARARCAAWDVGCWLLPPLDVAAMAAGAAAMAGHHDFRSFTSSQDPRRDAHRTLHTTAVRERAHYSFPLLGCFCVGGAAAPLPPESCPVCAGGGEPEGATAGAEGARLIQLQFCGEGFLKHQVRRMVGLLVRIGLGEETEPGVVPQALGNPFDFDRRRAQKAPAHGLWLERVDTRDASTDGVALSVAAPACLVGGSTTETDSPPILDEATACLCDGLV